MSDTTAEADVVVMKSTAQALNLRAAGVALNAGQVEVIRVYLQGWIDAPQWDDLDDIDDLRHAIETIDNQSELEAWIKRVTDLKAAPFEPR